LHANIDAALCSVASEKEEPASSSSSPSSHRELLSEAVSFPFPPGLALVDCLPACLPAARGAFARSLFCSPFSREDHLECRRAASAAASTQQHHPVSQSVSQSVFYLFAPSLLRSSGPARGALQTVHSHSINQSIDQSIDQIQSNSIDQNPSIPRSLRSCLLTN